MLSLFDPLRDLTMLSMTVRMLLATLCGGIVGLEREYKRRPAGFRTHILICLGACMTTLTSQYLLLTMHYFTDIARLGAQVIAGIGFIGAGAIIVTRRRCVKGLTTAAGLWASAIIGLTAGSGFYEGALFATLLILLVEIIFARFEYRMMDNTPEVNLYIEYTDRSCLENILQMFHNLNVKVTNLEITRSSTSEHHNSCAIFTLQLSKKTSIKEMLEKVCSTQGVISIEEL